MENRTPEFVSGQHSLWEGLGEESGFKNLPPRLSTGGEVVWHLGSLPAAVGALETKNLTELQPPRKTPSRPSRG